MKSGWAELIESASSRSAAPCRIEPGGESGSARRQVGRALRRALGWRCPPNWSLAAWHEEVLAIARLAVVQAGVDFRADRGVPFASFASGRILARVYTRYRQEWAFALRISQGNPDSQALLGRESPRRLDDVNNLDLPDQEELWKALGRLSGGGAELLCRLFLHGKSETELARRLGITQQAVSKRKRKALRQLRTILEAGGGVS